MVRKLAVLLVASAVVSACGVSTKPDPLASGGPFYIETEPYGTHLMRELWATDDQQFKQDLCERFAQDPGQAYKYYTNGSDSLTQEEFNTFLKEECPNV